MILKIQYLKNRKTSPVKWILKENFYEIHHQKVWDKKLSKLDTSNYDEIANWLKSNNITLTGGSMMLIDAEKNKNEVALTIIHCYGKEGNQTIITNYTTYILNDNGKTVESLYAR